MRIAIDVNRYIDFCRNDPTAVRTISTAQQLVMPFIVIAELRGGFRFGTKSAANERDLVRFLQSNRVAIVYPDEATTHVYASIYAELRAQGTPIPVNDMWIAAIVVQHDFVLFSRDAHFTRVARLARI